MSQIKIKAELGISRNSSGVITIRLADDTSRVGFVEVSLTPEQFALAITGLMLSDIDVTCRGLDVVGKTVVRERREILCPVKSYDKKVFEQWLTDNAQEEGWKLSVYLGSQGSVTYKDDGALLRYNVYKYV